MPNLQSSATFAAPFKTFADDVDMSPLHPGEVLREDFLPHCHFTPEALAHKLGVSVATVHDLLAERQDVTADLAQRLGTVFAISARYWRALQLQHDLWHARSDANEAAPVRSRTTSRRRRTAA